MRTLPGNVFSRDGQSFSYAFAFAEIIRRTSSQRSRSEEAYEPETLFLNNPRLPCQRLDTRAGARFISLNSALRQVFSAASPRSYKKKKKNCAGSKRSEAPDSSADGNRPLAKLRYRCAFALSMLQDGGTCLRLVWIFRAVMFGLTL